MAIPEDELYQVRGDADARFVDQSHLTYMIPFETDLNLEEAFKDVDPSAPILESIRRRKSLFFGTSKLTILSTRGRQRARGV